MKLRTIQNIYDSLNRENFGGRLERPTIRLTRHKDNHAHYQFGGNTSRTLMEFNPADTRGLQEMRATVFHEMVHQFVYEILDTVEKDDHGDVFWLTYFTFANPTFAWEKPDDHA